MEQLTSPSVADGGLVLVLFADRFFMKLNGAIYPCGTRHGLARK